MLVCLTKHSRTNLFAGSVSVCLQNNNSIRTVKTYLQYQTTLNTYMSLDYEVLEKDKAKY